MRISQEAYGRIRARLEALLELFSALQQDTFDWYGQPSTVLLQTARVRRRSKDFRTEVPHADTKAA